MTQTSMKQTYRQEVAPALKEKFQYANTMQVPAIKKVTVNVGAGPKHAYNLDAIADNLKKITGQAPVKTVARKSVSNFKIREGQPIGLRVTLRGERMYHFLDKLIHVTLPRVHDFRGLSANAFDKQGNYSIGLRDQLAFPEVSAESIEQLHGVQVVVTTNATSEEEGYELLKQLGFPLRDKKTKKKS